MEANPVENPVPAHSTPGVDNLPAIVSAPMTAASLTTEAALPNGTQQEINDQQSPLDVNKAKDLNPGPSSRRRSTRSEYDMDPEEEPEEEEWQSDEELPKTRKRQRKVQTMEDDDDEDEEYGRVKRKKAIVVRKPSRHNAPLNEPSGMKALRRYTSALKLGTRCFRNLNRISNVKEREAELIARLHECDRYWSGEYPTESEILEAKEETRRKKAEKAREFIIDDEPGARSTRKAAQKARDFVKTLGGEAEPEAEVGDDDDDVEAPIDEELPDEE